MDGYVKGRGSLRALRPVKRQLDGERSVSNTVLRVGTGVEV